MFDVHGYALICMLGYFYQSMCFEIQQTEKYTVSTTVYADSVFGASKLGHLVFKNIHNVSGVRPRIPSTFDQFQVRALPFWW
jgi:hypothetical protein